ncbi:MAG: hypothetical protein ABIK37_07200 [candidate division WOR-3 bacterium]
MTYLSSYFLSYSLRYFPRYSIRSEHLSLSGSASPICPTFRKCWPLQDKETKAERPTQAQRQGTTSLPAASAGHGRCGFVPTGPSERLERSTVEPAGRVAGAPRTG